jgi:imidazolonepropionase-like amidohydrolase
MGTDSGVMPHGQNIREIEQYVGLGMTPAQAMVTATRTASELMGLQDVVGTLRPGTRADLLVSSAAPLDIGAIKDHVTAVYQDGVKVG